MDIKKLEVAVKSIFLQCVEEPDLFEIIKEKMNGKEVENNDIEETTLLQSADGETEKSEGFNAEIIIQRIDEILAGQSEIKKEITTISDIMGTKEEAKRQYDERIKDIEKNNQEKIKNYEKKLSDDKKKIEDSEQEIEGLIENCEHFKKQKEDLEAEKNKLEEKYSVFEKASEIWNGMLELDEGKRRYIEELCGSFDVMAVLSLGRDERKIGQLWSYLRDVAVKADESWEQGLSTIIQYFEFCIDVANSTKSEKYIRMDIELDSEFEISTCIKTANSRQIGKIQKIVVPGFKLEGNIKYKAIVIVM